MTADRDPREAEPTALAPHEQAPEPSTRKPAGALDVPPRRRELAGHRVDVLGAIAAGGVLGSEARYGLGLALPHTPAQWPTATLLINTSGCLLIGVLMVLITEAVEPHRLVRPFLGVGVLGGYTTFSTYSVDLVALLDGGRPGAALGYLVVTPVVALAAVWAGSAATRAVIQLLRGRCRRRAEAGRGQEDDQ